MYGLVIIMQSSDLLDFILINVIMCNKRIKHSFPYIKAALSVTFDILTLEIKFLFFKNTEKILKFR